MKRTYKLLGYLLLGIGAYAILNANNTDLQATSPVTEQQQTTYKRNRHTITLVLSQLSDLKVEEGQRINVNVSQILRPGKNCILRRELRQVIFYVS